MPLLVLSPDTTWKTGTPGGDRFVSGNHVAFFPVA
jgi:hypothetical protein